MKITALNTFIARYRSRPGALVKVETDEGLYGWGEAYGTGPELTCFGIVDTPRSSIFYRYMRCVYEWSRNFTSEKAV